MHLSRYTRGGGGGEMPPHPKAHRVGGSLQHGALPSLVSVQSTLASYGSPFEAAAALCRPGGLVTTRLDSGIGQLPLSLLKFACVNFGEMTAYF